MTRMVAAILVVLSAANAGAAAEAVRVPPKVAKVYAAAREAWERDAYAEALALLDAYEGDAHALLLLLRGRILHDSGDDEGAVLAYTRCVEADPTRRDAGLGLVNSLVALDRNAEALPHCGRWIDPASSSSPELHLYAVVALRAGERDLAWQLARRGRVRFPEHEGLRRVLLRVLIDAEECRDAEICLADSLRRAPEDPELWRYLALLRNASGDAGGAPARAALEAALLSNPDDAILRAALTRSQLAARQVHAAYENARALVAGDAPGAEALALAVRCALEAGETAQARAWLSTVPAPKRTRDLHRLAVSLALAEGDAAAARADLALLLEAGDADDRLLLQAAALDEKLGRKASAEALLSACVQAGGPSSDVARLHLARLLLTAKRFKESAKQVRQYLTAHPADRLAERMLRVITAQERAHAARGEAGP